MKNCLFLGQPLMYPTDKESSNLCLSRFDRNVLDRENILKHSKILQQSNHLVKNIFLRNSVYQCIVENLDLPWTNQYYYEKISWSQITWYIWIDICVLIFALNKFAYEIKQILNSHFFKYSKCILIANFIMC